MSSTSYLKYLKYKAKYMQLKKELEGGYVEALTNEDIDSIFDSFIKPALTGVELTRKAFDDYLVKTNNKNDNSEGIIYFLQTTYEKPTPWTEKELTSIKRFICWVCADFDNGNSVADFGANKTLERWNSNRKKNNISGMPEPNTPINKATKKDLKALLKYGNDNPACVDTWEKSC